MGDRLGQVLLTAEEIHGRVRELGDEISRDYQGQELLLVGVLRGAVVFLADLMRAINVAVACDFIGVSSYGPGKTPSGAVQITSDLSQTIEGKNVLLVEPDNYTLAVAQFEVNRKQNTSTCEPDTDEFAGGGVQ